MGQTVKNHHWCWLLSHKFDSTMLLSAFLWCDIIFVSMLQLPLTFFIISWIHISLGCALQAVVYEVLFISIDTSLENLTTLFY